MVELADNGEPELIAEHLNDIYGTIIQTLKDPVDLRSDKAGQDIPPLCIERRLIQKRKQ